MITCPKCKFQFMSTLRSTPQNRYYWGVVVQILSDHIGFTPEETHEVLKHKFLQPKEKLGYMIYPNTSQLTTQEFNTYIERIQRWAAIDLYCVIHDPNEETNKKITKE